ncbi:MAG: C40 family peptidase [Pseudolysinimonas sp.]
MLPGNNHHSGDGDTPLANRTSGRRSATPESRIKRIAKTEAKALVKAEKRGDVTVANVLPVASRTARGTKKPAILNLAVMAIVVPGLFCTVALPAYAFQEHNDDAANSSAELQALKENGAQTVAVSEDLVAAAVLRDNYTATSAAEMRRIALAAAYRSYSGPSVRQYLANPPYPNFDLNQVVEVAKQYQGVPYRFGGSDPSGFDCSGFTMYVYAQFGIALPHSSSRQITGGTVIAPSAALPGDLVAMDGGGHIGIYLGGNTMIDAGTPGTVISIRDIYNPNRVFVRYGI